MIHEISLVVSPEKIPEKNNSPCLLLKYIRVTFPMEIFNCQDRSPLGLVEINQENSFENVGKLSDFHVTSQKVDPPNQ